MIHWFVRFISVFFIVACSMLECMGQSWNAQIMISGQKTDTLNHVALDSTEAVKFITDYAKDINAQGKFIAVIDSSKCSNQECKAFIFCAKHLSSKELSLDSAATIALENHKLPFIVDSLAFNTLVKKVGVFYAERGYPFVQVSIDSSTIDENHSLHANVVVDKGTRFTYDSIINKSNLRINPKIYNRLIGIKSGSLYNHREAVAIGSRLSQLNYAKSQKPHDIRFVNGVAHVYTYLEKQAASRFDLLLGILPQESSTGRSWLVTGDVLIEMHNALQYGEYLFGQYKGLPNGNTEVLLKSTVPYIGALPVGSHLDFRLFRNSDKHVDVYFDGGGQYLFGGFNNIKILYNSRISSLISVDTASIITGGRLPQRLDTRYNGVGMSVDIRKVDYRLNPYKGFTIISSVSLGSRRIIENAAITTIEGFENAYDSLSSPTLQAEAFLALAFYQKIKSWASIKIGSTSSLKYNKSRLQLNEFYRVGGSRSLRGFDEESILSDAYSYVTAEFRFVFDRNSYLSLPFIDFGYTHIDNEGVQKWDRVLGVGLGLNFATKAGIFNTSLAAGSAQERPLDFSKLKVHMGYVSLF
jgi:outer membrane protein assembly factor BamA